MGWKEFSDRLAFILVFIIPMLWVANKWVGMPGEIIGATILAWGLIIQHYFRKRMPE